ncbi:adenosylcobinamide-GDP ribazoletransferase [Aurantimonas sp. C2-6-R+9]|uniref:adenosylcobinamide-GDP ribazoletransferase n=1 Tax=unclassified Aurantimonas TaxID=2638230 RepID=UPI002E17822B|nr:MULTISPECIES: adenosylcobinamide-GDP ribazoletransferase [unclassified Aurantimonas]MEC5289795.1 adenosylcobinamide-GDP ribazoletransferase [Aurantimonas sp. C2-3-R2]MEC5379762.1 adenosylcobinamide-GDP ribazoletransferase [Aurantimonas sp. C2-6-R+9]MEC5410766.1 adenosylcobinamide-GDP ribazoletransferase [Aurantimonas sp. C2-4-R8]
MREFTASTMRSLAFLTRLPPARRAFTGTHPLGEDVHAFPLAGLIAALPAALILFLGPAVGLSALVVASLAVAAMVFVTGALHEDGLGDAADGLGGHHERERALAIMKDSRVGSYGALALVLSVALRIALLAELVEAGPAGAALALLGVAAASRGAMAWLWASLPSASVGGTADRMGRPDRRNGRAALLIGDGLFLVAGILAVGFGPTFAGFLLGGLVLLWFRGFIERRLGGQTGDCLGASQQLVEIAALLGLALGSG